MPNKLFLESFPLFRRFKGYLSDYLNQLPKVPVHMECEKCESEQTFGMVNDYFEGQPYQNSNPNGRVCRLVYRCASCKEYERYFIVRFGKDGEGKQYVTKVGQYPPWNVAVDETLAKNLGNAVDPYRKGLICESQGYGIGAFSYYRRIVEDILDSLLDDIASLMSGPERKNYEIALARTKNTRVAQEKIDLVKDLLPGILRPDDMNPLGVLHHALSEGLHAKSDEECIADAAEIREVLVFLVTQTAAAKSSTRIFSDSMRKLLNKKANQDN